MLVQRKLILQLGKGVEDRFVLFVEIEHSTHGERDAPTGPMKLLGEQGGFCFEWLRELIHGGADVAHGEPHILIKWDDANFPVWEILTPAVLRAVKLGGIRAESATD